MASWLVRFLDDNVPLSLVWLNRADPCETVAKVREDDPNRTGLLAVLAQWREAIGSNGVRTVREIINVAITHPDFMAALLTVASSKSATVISNDRLGRWLKQNEGKVAAGLSIVRAGNTHGYHRTLQAYLGHRNIQHTVLYRTVADALQEPLARLTEPVVRLAFVSLWDLFHPTLYKLSFSSMARRPFTP